MLDTPMFKFQDKMKAAVKIGQAVAIPLVVSAVTRKGILVNPQASKVIPKFSTAALRATPSAFRAAPMPGKQIMRAASKKLQAASMVGRPKPVICF